MAPLMVSGNTRVSIMGAVVSKITEKLNSCERLPATSFTLAVTNKLAVSCKAVISKVPSNTPAVTIAV